jgi:transposase
MLTDVNGFPLRIQAFEGNRAETKTFLPSVEAFMDTYDLHDVTVVADAGMISEANRRDLNAAGLSYVALRLSECVASVKPSGWAATTCRGQGPGK